jgi:hypothetical protein
MFIELRRTRFEVANEPVIIKRIESSIEKRTSLSPLGGLWKTEVGQLSEIVEIWPYQSAQQRQDILEKEKELHDWPPQVGEYVLEERNFFLQAAPFSPPLTAGTFGGVYELRSYTYNRAAMPFVWERWNEKIQGRMGLSPIIGCWFANQAYTTQWVHMWVYRDLKERQEIRAEAIQKGLWPPGCRKEGVWLTWENALLSPLSCSPLR